MKKIPILLFMAFMLMSAAQSFGQCLNTRFITPIMVHNPNPDTLLDHQVLLIMNTAALVSAGKMDSTGADIRFSNGDCCTLLCYAIDSNMNSAATHIWVNVPMIPANDSAEIWMTYGNTSAAPGQDWNCTFDLWEPFDTSVTQFYTTCGSLTHTVAGGELDMIWYNNGMMASNTIFPVSEVYTAEMYVTSATGAFPGIHWNNTYNYKGYSLMLGQNQIIIGVAGSLSFNYCRSANLVNTAVPGPGTTGLWELTWVATGDQRTRFPGYGPLVSNDAQHGRDYNQVLCIGSISKGNGTMSVDWVRVRKWANIPPTVTWGVEQPFVSHSVNLNDADLCPDSSLTLNAGIHFVSYSWSTGDTGAIIPVDTSGIYTVLVVDSMGCSSTDSAVVSLFPAPAVYIGADTSLCPGESLTLDAGSGFMSYDWSNGDNADTSLVSGAGTYSVMVTDSNGCAATDSVTLGALTAPTAAFTATPGSTGFDVIFADGSTNSSTYSWDFGDGNSSTDQHPNHTYATDGSYVVCLTVTSTDGCTDTSCDTVVVTGVRIDEGLDGAAVTLFPNPVQQELFVYFERGIAGHVDLQVMDMKGALIRESGHVVAAGDRLRLDLGELAAGVYLLRVQTESGSLSRRFVVKQD